MIVTGHQLNLLPGISVTEKIRASDALIVMDEMQYERHNFVNRNRFSDGAWFTVPVAETDTFQPINRVRIADPTHRGREKVARTLEHKLGPAAAGYASELRRPYAALTALNWRLLLRLLSDLGIEVEIHLQSMLASGRYADTSEGLAAMVAEIGGTVWLSGPSGRNYLDDSPFESRGIEVSYFDFEGANPTALEVIAA